MAASLLLDTLGLFHTTVLNSELRFSTLGLCVSFRMGQNGPQCFYSSLRKVTFLTSVYMERNWRDILRVCRKYWSRLSLRLLVICIFEGGLGVEFWVESVQRAAVSLAVLIWGGGLQMSLVPWDSYPAWFRRNLSSFKHKQHPRPFLLFSPPRLTFVEGVE